MGKFILNAAPTFKAKVGFPLAGGEPVDVELTFKHRTKKGLEEFVNTRADRTDVDSFMDMVEAWDIDEPYTKDNVETLLENFIGVALATYRKYVDELMQARRGN